MFIAINAAFDRANATKSERARFAEPHSDNPSRFGAFARNDQLFASSSTRSKSGVTDERSANAAAASSSPTSVGRACTTNAKSSGSTS